MLPSVVSKKTLVTLAKRKGILQECGGVVRKDHSRKGQLIRINRSVPIPIRSLRLEVRDRNTQHMFWINTSLIRTLLHQQVPPVKLQTTPCLHYLGTWHHCGYSESKQGGPPNGGRHRGITLSYKWKNLFQYFKYTRPSDSLRCDTHYLHRRETFPFRLRHRLLTQHSISHWHC